MDHTLSLTLDDPRVVTLCKQDPKLGELIHCIGDLTTRLRTDYFGSLISSIIGQQLSVKAAATIRGRVIEAVPEFTPGAIFNTEEAVFRSAGVSTSLYEGLMSESDARGTESGSAQFVRG